MMHFQHAVERSSQQDHLARGGNVDARFSPTAANSASRLTGGYNVQSDKQILQSLLEKFYGIETSAPSQQLTLKVWQEELRVGCE